MLAFCLIAGFPGFAMAVTFDEDGTALVGGVSSSSSSPPNGFDARGLTAAALPLLTGIGLTGTAKAFLTGGPDGFGFPSEKDSLFGADIVGSRASGRSGYQGGALSCFHYGVHARGSSTRIKLIQDVFLDHSSIETGDAELMPILYTMSFIAHHSFIRCILRRLRTSMLLKNYLDNEREPRINALQIPGPRTKIAGKKREGWTEPSPVKLANMP
jgi:hypothetical protein